MIRKEAILSSPLRLLDRSIRGGLGKGHLGVIMAPPGVGKSACLVQIGLDALFRDKPVLHVAAGQSVDHVATRYDALFDDLADRVELADRRGVREAILRRRLIWSVGEGTFSARGLDDALAAFAAHLDTAPRTVLVDGWGWEGPGCAPDLAAMKAAAARAGAELWMTARDAPAAGRPRRIEPLPDACAALVDIGIFLEPHGRHARLTLVKDYDRYPGADVHVVLEGGTLRIPTPEDDEEDGAVPASAEAPEAAGAAPGEPAPAALAPGACTLLATATAGAEAEFGLCAERWGLQEVNFTFAGRREVARTRGLVELAEDDLRLGDVSAAYLRAHLHRTFEGSAELRRVLEVIWHQVSTAGEVFAVGAVNADGTATGGTGWAVELARHWGKPVHVFDQGLRGWLRWDGRRWAEAPAPAISHERFAGAGTRAPSPLARDAIRGLFERSFGAPPAP